MVKKNVSRNKIKSRLARKVKELSKDEKVAFVYLDKKGKLKCAGTKKWQKRICKALKLPSTKKTDKSQDPFGSEERAVVHTLKFEQLRKMVLRIVLPPESFSGQQTKKKKNVWKQERPPFWPEGIPFCSPSARKKGSTGKFQRILGKNDLKEIVLAHNNYAKNKHSDKESSDEENCDIESSEEENCDIESSDEENCDIESSDEEKHSDRAYTPIVISSDEENCDIESSDEEKHSDRAYAQITESSGEEKHSDRAYAQITESSEEEKHSDRAYALITESSEEEKHSDRAYAQITESSEEEKHSDRAYALITESSEEEKHSDRAYAPIVISSEEEKHSDRAYAPITESSEEESVHVIDHVGEQRTVSKRLKRRVSVEENLRVASFQGIDVYERHLATLDKKKWLVDTIVDVLLSYYCEIASVRSFAFSSCFVTTLMLNGEMHARPLDLSGCHVDRVKGFTPQNIESFDYVFVPFCDMVHWWLACYNIATGRLSILCSAGLKNKAAADSLKRYFQHVREDQIWPTWVPEISAPVFENVAKQTNSYDCGVFITEYARCILDGRDIGPDLVESQMVQQRRPALKELIESLGIFPLKKAARVN